MRAERIRAGFVQTRPRFGRVEENLERAGRAVEGAGAFDVLVLPEFFATGYLFLDREEAMRFAEPPDGPTVRQLGDWAHRCGGWIAGGFPERDGERVYNSGALVGPEGTVRVYRKIHLFDREKLLFDPGDRPFEAWEIETGPGTCRVGMMICFDWMFPESARCLALDGAEVILHPSNLVLPHCQDAMGTRCLENGVFALTANRTGVDDRGRQSLAFTGCSQIAGPGGNVMARAPEEGECVAVEELDLGLARDKRVRERNELLRDRRPECYRTLCPREG